jgi:hypothetical protein
MSRSRQLFTYDTKEFNFCLLIILRELVGLCPTPRSEKFLKKFFRHLSKTFNFKRQTDNSKFSKLEWYYG